MKIQNFQSLRQLNVIENGRLDLEVSTSQEETLVVGQHTATPTTTSTMASKDCSRCNRKFKLSEFDLNRNGNLNKRCRRCAEKSRKVSQRCRERRKFLEKCRKDSKRYYAKRKKEAAVEAAVDGDGLVCSCFKKKRKLTAFDSKKNEKEIRVDDRHTKRLKRIVGDICDNVRAQFNDAGIQALITCESTPNKVPSIRINISNIHTNDSTRL